MLGNIISAFRALAAQRLMRPVWTAVAIFALLFGVVLATMPTPAPVQAQNTACFRAQGGALWACEDGGTMEFREGSTLSVDTFLTTAPQLDLAVTMNGHITPTGTFQPVRSAGGGRHDSLAA